jgi:hypothetical protein
MKMFANADQQTFNYCRMIRVNQSLNYATKAPSPMRELQYELLYPGNCHERSPVAPHLSCLAGSREQIVIDCPSVSCRKRSIFLAGADPPAAVMPFNDALEFP